MTIVLQGAHTKSYKVLYWFSICKALRSISIHFHPISATGSPPMSTYPDSKCKNNQPVFSVCTPGTVVMKRYKLLFLY